MSTNAHAATLPKMPSWPIRSQKWGGSQRSFYWRRKSDGVKEKWILRFSVTTSDDRFSGWTVMKLCCSSQCWIWTERPVWWLAADLIMFSGYSWNDSERQANLASRWTVPDISTVRHRIAQQKRGILHDNALETLRNADTAEIEWAGLRNIPLSTTPARPLIKKQAQAATASK